MIEKSISKHLYSTYQKAHPFPHIIIDNFLPEDIANQIHKELTQNDLWYRDSENWVQEYQVNKFFLPSGNKEEIHELEAKVPKTSLVIDYLNSKEFISFLEELTGVENLFSDSQYLHGGGVHKINNGGELAVHLDYNIHPKTKMFRKLNLLLYLNPYWEKEWGGDLEFWTKHDSHPAVSIEPLFNRCVIFTISPISFHGHPNPIQCPENVSRYSIALYYFSDEKPEVEHDVVFMKGAIQGIDLEEFSQDIIFGTTDFGK